MTIICCYLEFLLFQESPTHNVGSQLGRLNDNFRNQSQSRRILSSASLQLKTAWQALIALEQPGRTHYISGSGSYRLDLSVNLKAMQG